MKKFKKPLVIIASFLLLSIGALAAIPYFFKDKIIALIKENINESLYATVDFTDVDISLLRNFPNARVGIEKFSLINHAPFEGDSLFTADEITLKMSIKELFKGSDEPMKLDYFSVTKAQVSILVNEEGVANYDIAKPSENTSQVESEPFTFSVSGYEIKDGIISYKDASSGMELLISEFNHQGSGDLSTAVSELQTHSEAKVSFTFDGTNYLQKIPLKLDALIGVDLTESKYSFLQNEALINQLPLNFDGYIQLLEQGQMVDITFKTPSSDFKNFLAVLPETYTQNIANVQTQGNFEISGFFKGMVDDNHIPTFDIRIESKNAMFKYPDLPKSVRNINLNTEIANKTGITNDTYVTIERLSFQIDQDVFSANAHIKNIIENPIVDATINGKLNLGNLSKAYPMPQKVPMKGLLTANIHTYFDMQSIEQKQYERTRNEGKLSLNNFEYNGDEMATPLAINSADLSFNPTTVSLQNFVAKTGKTDLQAQGSIHNLLGFFFRKEKLEGNFNLNSNHFALSDFMVAEGETLENENTTPDSGEETIKIPSFLDITINANAQTVTYDNLTLKDVKGTLRIDDEKATLQDFQSGIFGGKLALNGSVSTKESTPVFDMNLGINSFDISQSFKGMDLLQALAPIASALQGKLNSTLSLKGTLKEDFTPNLANISGNALAELLASNIKPEQSKALSLLGNQLSFIDFSKIDLSKLKTSISFNDGKVNLKPLTIQYQDIAIELGGSHGLDNSMDYNATFQVPAKYLGKDVNNLLNSLSPEEAQQITIPVSAQIGGSFSNPSVSTNMKQSVTSLTNQLVAYQKEKLTNQGKEKLTNALTGLLGNKKDSTQTNVSDSTKTKTTDETKAKVEEKAKDALKNLFGKRKRTR